MEHRIIMMKYSEIYYMEFALFEKYCNGNGLDIGYGGDILCDNCQGFDL